MISLKRINAINLMVRDLEESVSWYRRHFGFEEQYAVEGGMLISVGGIELVLSPTHYQKLPPANPRDHLCIHTLAFELDKADYETAKGAFASGEGYTEIKHPHFQSIIVNDPNGYCIELYFDKIPR